MAQEMDVEILGSRQIRIASLQYLPNSYYLFFFANVARAQQMFSQGTWLFRNFPMVVHRCY